MAFLSGKHTTIWHGSAHESGWFNSLDLNRAVTQLLTSTFGGDDVTRIAGLLDGGAKGGGLWDGATNALDDILAAAFATPQPVTAQLQTDAVGNRAYLLYADTAKYDIKSAVAGLVTFDAEWSPERGIARGRVLHARTSESATGTGTTVHDATGPTTTGWRFHFHVFSLTGGSAPAVTGKLQDSANGSTWADVTGASTGALSAKGGATLWSAANTTTLREYVRVAWTITGTPTGILFAAAAARHRG